MEKLRIIIMDDEIYANDGNASIQAEEELKALGHIVDTTDKMSDVLSGIKNKYYDVYILDVDMSFVDDEIKGANGATIGRVMRERNSFYNIIVFSARGEVHDWFTAANYHFQGYIFKGNDGVKNLVEHISNISVDKKIDISFKKPENDNSVLIYYNPKTPSEKLSLDNIKNIINKTIPNSKVFVFNKLIDLKTKLSSSRPALVLMFHSMFLDSETTYMHLKDILIKQPFPNIIVGVDSSFGAGSEESNRGPILKIVNLHPFKFLDINMSNVEEELKRMIKNAIDWYGKIEIFDYPDDFNDYYGKPLDEDDLNAIRGADDYFDLLDFDEDEYNNDNSESFDGGEENGK